MIVGMGARRVAVPSTMYLAVNHGRQWRGTGVTGTTSFALIHCTATCKATTECIDGGAK